MTVQNYRTVSFKLWPVACVKNPVLQISIARSSGTDERATRRFEPKHCLTEPYAHTEFERSDSTRSRDKRDQSSDLRIVIPEVGVAAATSGDVI